MVNYYSIDLVSTALLYLWYRNNKRKRVGNIDSRLYPDG